MTHLISLMRYTTSHFKTLKKDKFIFQVILCKKSKLQYHFFKRYQSLKVIFFSWLGQWFYASMIFELFSNFLNDQYLLVIFSLLIPQKKCVQMVTTNNNTIESKDIIKFKSNLWSLCLVSNWLIRNVKSKWEQPILGFEN